MMIWIPEEERYINSDHIVSIDYELSDFATKPDAKHPDGSRTFAKVVFYLDTGVPPIVAFRSELLEEGQDEAWRQMVRVGEIINGSERTEKDIW